MTHKDFVLIAGALAEARASIEASDDATIRAAMYAALHMATRELARALRGTNPRFDMERFLAAARGEPQTGRDKVRA